MYRELTRGILVEVRPEYVPERSRPAQAEFFFAYHVRITNQGDHPVQLISRHWVITDGEGRSHEVQGEGVVGEQPHLKPGEAFDYSSFCPLPTPTGNMRGSYEFRDAEGGLFRAKIPLFFLRDLRNLN
jgi:ApaG protein